MRNPKIGNSTKRSKTRQNLPKGNFKIEDNECHFVLRVYDINSFSKIQLVVYYQCCVLIG